jgi:hypothetical protein
MRLLAILAVAALLGCTAEKKTSARAAVPHGPLAALMTQHAAATCGKSTRRYDGVFWHPPYQICTAALAESAESAEIDSDSVVVELTNTWTLAPAAQAGAFSQAQGELMSQFGSPIQCTPTKVEWRQGDSLDVVLWITPASQVGTEFDEGPYRMTRIGRLGPLDAAVGGC